MHVCTRKCDLWVCDPRASSAWVSMLSCKADRLLPCDLCHHTVHLIPKRPVVYYIAAHVMLHQVIKLARISCHFRPVEGFGAQFYLILILDSRRPPAKQKFASCDRRRKKVLCPVIVQTSTLLPQAVGTDTGTEPSLVFFASRTLFWRRRKECRFARRDVIATLLGILLHVQFTFWSKREPTESNSAWSTLLLLFYLFSLLV